MGAVPISSRAHRHNGPQATQSLLSLLLHTMLRLYQPVQDAHHEGKSQWTVPESCALAAFHSAAGLKGTSDLPTARAPNKAQYKGTSSPYVWCTHHDGKSQCTVPES